MYILIIIIISFILVSVAWLIHQGKKEYRVTTDGLIEINAISPEEAERRALLILKDSTQFECVEFPIQKDDTHKLLADGLIRLFNKYESVESMSGTKIRLDRNIIDTAPFQPGYTVIGCGMEGTDVEFQIGVNGQSEKVYEIYQTEPPDPEFGTYSSVYHFLLAISQKVR